MSLANEVYNRVIQEATFIASTGCTIRATALNFGVSKSTVHKDMTVKLAQIKPDLVEPVRAVLDTNLNERHIRGGEATKGRYLREVNR